LRHATLRTKSFRSNLRVEKNRCAQMQNRYVGDIGDYGKYALLRRLCGLEYRNRSRLAVVWCVFPDEDLNNDGRHISYLKDPSFADLDPDLYSALSNILSTGQRKIAAIENYGFLPSSTVFISELIFSLDNMRKTKAERIAYRNAWLHASLKATE